jgi:hypothetical protein
LPREVRQLADRSYKLLNDNPTHRSLHFKKVGKFWSARVGIHYRAIAVDADADLAWFWIGSHADYDKLLGRRPAHQRLQPTAARGGGKKRKPSRGG